VKTSIFVFWVVRPSGLVGRYQYFGGTYCPHLKGLIFVSIFTATGNLVTLKGDKLKYDVLETPESITSISRFTKTVLLLPNYFYYCAIKLHQRFSCRPTCYFDSRRMNQVINLRYYMTRDFIIYTGHTASLGERTILQEAAFGCATGKDGGCSPFGKHPLERSRRRR
jgi:hypothetical protein